MRRRRRVFGRYMEKCSKLEKSLDSRNSGTVRSHYASEGLVRGEHAVKDG